MGELIKILDYLERKHYGKYFWAYERIRFSPYNSWDYINSLEDCHGYSLVS